MAAPAAPAQPPAPAPAPAPAASAPWPTFADGVTPLPVFPDGSPDWNAYYTGQPSSGARFWFTEGASTPTAPAAQGHDGYPPAPPLHS